MVHQNSRKKNFLFWNDQWWSLIILSQCGSDPPPPVDHMVHQNFSFVWTTRFLCVAFLLKEQAGLPVACSCLTKSFERKVLRGGAKTVNSQNNSIFWSMSVDPLEQASSLEKFKVLDSKAFLIISQSRFEFWVQDVVFDTPEWLSSFEKQFVEVTLKVLRSRWCLSKGRRRRITDYEQFLAVGRFSQACC